MCTARLPDPRRGSRCRRPTTGSLVGTVGDPAAAGGVLGPARVRPRGCVALGFELVALRSPLWRGERARALPGQVHSGLLADPEHARPRVERARWPSGSGERAQVVEEIVR